MMCLRKTLLPTHLEEEVSGRTDEIEEDGCVRGDEKEEDPSVMVEEVVLNELEGGQFVTSQFWCFPTARKRLGS